MAGVTIYFPEYHSNEDGNKKQHQLLQAIETKNYNKIEDLLSSNPELIKEEFEDYENKFFFQVVFQDFLQFIDTNIIIILLKYDTEDIIKQNSIDSSLLKLTTVHNKSILLETIIKTKPQLMDCIGNNLLHNLIENEDVNTDTSKIEECVTLLLNTNYLEGKKITVNNLSDKNKPAILLAAEYGYHHVVKAILKSKQGLHVNVDSDYDDYGKTARDLIKEKGWNDIELELCNYDQKYDLFKLIHRKDEAGFLKYNYGDISEWANASNSRMTILQECCTKSCHKEKLLQATKHLLANGADPFKDPLTNSLIPLHIAVLKDYYKLADILVDHYKKHEKKIPSYIICNVLESQDKSHFKCFDILTKYPTLIEPNKRSEKKDITPLEEALRHSTDKNVEILLKLGASLAVRGITISLMNADILESQLDDCVKHDKEKDEFVFHLETLIPPENSDDSNILGSHVIWSMSNSEHHRYLLNHPVIASYANVKWKKFNYLFYSNFIFYFLFCVCLVLYTFWSFANYEYTEGQSSTAVCYFLLFVMFILLFCKEIFVVLVFKGSYFTQMKNFVTIVLIFFTAFILYNPDITDAERKELASVSILFGTLQIALKSGQHPHFSMYMKLLHTVSIYFIHILMWYLFVIIGLVLSYFLMYCDTTDDRGYFTQFFSVLVQSITTITGKDNENLTTIDVIMNVIFFLLYVFMALLILFSILITLAVSITPKFQNEKELVKLIAIVHYVNYAENLLASIPASVQVLFKLKNLLSTESLIRANRSGWIKIEKLQLKLNQNILSAATWIIKTKMLPKLDKYIKSYKIVHEKQTYWRR